MISKSIDIRVQPRYQSLDGLRGVASIMVALCHFVSAFQWSLLSGGSNSSHFLADVRVSHTPLILFFNPELGVAIFFTLSGFVLASSVDGTRTTLQALVTRRWIRLAIPIFAASVFAWLIPVLGLNFSQPGGSLAKSYWLGDQYAHISLTTDEFLRLLFQSISTLLISQGDGGGIARQFNSNLWTMPIEFIGSIGLFFVYKIALNNISEKLSARLTIIFLFLAILWNTPFYGFPSGAALYELHRLFNGSLPKTHALKRNSFLAGAVILVLGIFFGGTPFELNVSTGGIYVYVALWLNRYVEPTSAITVMHHLGAIFIVASALLFHPFDKFLKGRVIQFLGRISFTLYLVQIPILCSIGAGIVLFFTPRIGYNLATIIALSSYLPIAILVAVIFTQYVDLPAITISRQISARFREKNGVGGQSLFR